MPFAAADSTGRIDRPKTGSPCSRWPNCRFRPRRRAPPPVPLRPIVTRLAAVTLDPDAVRIIGRAAAGAAAAANRLREYAVRLDARGDDLAGVGDGDGAAIACVAARAADGHEARGAAAARAAAAADRLRPDAVREDAGRADRGRVGDTDRAAVARRAAAAADRYGEDLEPRRLRRRRRRPIGRRSRSRRFPIVKMPPVAELFTVTAPPSPDDPPEPPRLRIDRPGLPPVPPPPPTDCARMPFARSPEV